MYIYNFYGTYHSSKKLNLTAIHALVVNNGITIQISCHLKPNYFRLNFPWNLVHFLAVLCNSDNSLFPDFQLYLGCFKFYFNTFYFVGTWYFGAIVTRENNKSLFPEDCRKFDCQCPWMRYLTFIKILSQSSGSLVPEETPHGIRLCL